MALIFPDVLSRLQQFFPARTPVYLVGGAVRDALLQREIKDLDFALSGDVLGTARRLANTIHAAYYPLDESRDTARLILSLADGSRQVLDFAALRGPDLESDLRLRDFTMNAMALPLHALDQLVDPLGGLEDLRRGVLRACSESAMQDDPLRVLRGIRLANANRWFIEAETRGSMRRALPNLAQVSSERVRDELFHILEGPRPATALETLEIMGGLPYVLPELAELKGVEQPAPHVRDVWGHTLDVVRSLEARSPGALLYLAALYHDSGKPSTRRQAPDGRVRFLEHEMLGEKLVIHRGQALHLSNDEIDRLRTVVRHHMRPLLLAQMDGLPSRRAIYRFYRDTGPAGVDICVHALADTLATYGPGLSQDTWMRQLDIARSLLEAWWEHPEESVAPPALLDGYALMQAFDLKPGPQIGRLLEALREAQATGQVTDRQQALEFTRQQLVAAGP